MPESIKIGGGGAKPSKPQPQPKGQPQPPASGGRRPAKKKGFLSGGFHAGPIGIKEILLILVIIGALIFLVRFVLGP
jgi:hypothetical protein